MRQYLCRWNIEMNVRHQGVCSRVFCCCCVVGTWHELLSGDPDGRHPQVVHGRCPGVGIGHGHRHRVGVHCHVADAFCRNTRGEERGAERGVSVTAVTYKSSWSKVTSEGGGGSRYGQHWAGRLLPMARCRWWHLQPLSLYKSSSVRVPPKGSPLRPGSRSDTKVVSTTLSLTIYSPRCSGLVRPPRRGLTARPLHGNNK